MTHAPAPPRGIYSPLVAFFTADDEPDLDAITAHALRMAKAGCAGVVIQGSNGEAMHLTDIERREIISAVRSALDATGHERVVIVAGIGSHGKKITLSLAHQAKDAGAEYALMLPASYWAAAMTPQVVKNYFVEVADECPLPIVVYNFPAVCNGISIDSETMLALARHPNIVGCKLTCGSMGTLNRVCAGVDERLFACMVGKAEFSLQGYVGGSPSMIAALANLSPKVLVAQYDAYASGNLKRAQELQKLLADADLAQMRLGVPGLKTAVAKYFGYGSARTRSPLPDGDIHKVEAVAGVLDKLIALEKKL